MCPARPAADFRKLHQAGNPLVLVNVWDAGTARMMESLGAQALATSSAALAYTLGKADGRLKRDESLAHAADIARAVNIPVSGDFENGYGDTPAAVAETVRLAHGAGLAGMSVEDTALPGDKPYPFEQAVERIAAAADAARKLSDDFVLTARADGVMIGAYDFAEARRRLFAFAEAGADCLYAPMLQTFDDITALCETSPLPVNVLVAGEYVQYSKSDFARIGVARLSLGSSLARAVHKLLHDSGKAMLGDKSDFTTLTNGMNSEIVDQLILR